MRAQYLYHSGIALYGEKVNVLIDYYAHKNGTPIPAELTDGSKPLYVLISHSHHDHYDKTAAKLGKVVIASEDVPEDCIKLAAGEHYADEHLRVSAYGSTDMGISFCIELDGMTIFHAGDLNDWHWQDESEAWYVEQAGRDFLAVVEQLAKDHPLLDAAFFPVDPRMGSDFDRGARLFCQRTACKAFIPIHFWENFEAANGFAPVAEHSGARFIALNHAGDTFKI